MNTKSITASILDNIQATVVISNWRTSTSKTCTLRNGKFYRMIQDCSYGYDYTIRDYRHKEKRTIFAFAESFQVSKNKKDCMLTLFVYDNRYCIYDFYRIDNATDTKKTENRIYSLDDITEVSREDMFNEIDENQRKFFERKFESYCKHRTSFAENGIFPYINFHYNTFEKDETYKRHFTTPSSWSGTAKDLSRFPYGEISIKYTKDDSEDEIIFASFIIAYDNFVREPTAEEMKTIELLRGNGFEETIETYPDSITKMSKKIMRMF